MKRYLPFLCALAGGILLALLLSSFEHAQPVGLAITRAQARSIADAEARRFGVPVERSWPVVSWEDSPLLEKELVSDAGRMQRAGLDPVVGPRLHYYKIIYYRIGLEKNPEFATVMVGLKGEVLGIRVRQRAETVGAKLTAEQLRPAADRFIRSRALAGAPNPRFEIAKPIVLNNRIDYAFRYRVPSTFPLGAVGLYLDVYFNGDRLAGWTLVEGYTDGSAYRGETGQAVAGTFGRFGVILVLLIVLLAIFLRKYHAGEAGVETGGLLFAVCLGLSLIVTWLIAGLMAVNTQAGGIDARMTEVVVGGFKLLFSDIPLAVLVFLSWSVGESYARERWGARLASFDAILRRDPVNATVGRSVLAGVLFAPLAAAAALLPPWIAMHAGLVHPALGEYSGVILGSRGGPVTMVFYAALDALLLSIVAFLFVLAAFRRKGSVALGFVVAALVGTAMGGLQAPFEPPLYQFAFGFGGVAACAALFFLVDVLAAASAVFTATLLLGFLPLYLAAADGAATGLLLGMVIPIAVLLAFAAAGLATRREVAYEATDLAPHVRRIVERERVKAEIDAANRIQAALLPAAAPVILGAEVASHYRSATEIGGDYFDFLPIDGKIGLAFGDVSGHGLTSGIVMSMAKAALLVQVDYDASPVKVMEMLNEVVIKTAPRRILMTFFFGILDPRAQTLRFSSAGHLDPYVFRARTRRLESLSAWGFPLGVRRRDPFRELSVGFEPGDRLILYSDGLIEAVDDDGSPFGFDRFERILMESGEGSADEIKRAVLNSVKRFTRNRPPEDDQTLVVVSFEATEDEALTA